MDLKDVEGDVDPGQTTLTAPISDHKSSLIWVCTVCSELRIFTVAVTFLRFVTLFVSCYIYIILCYLFCTNNFVCFV